MLHGASPGQLQSFSSWKIAYIANNGNNIFTSVELNFLALSSARHTFRFKGGNFQGVIVPVKFFLPPFSAGKAELKP